MDKELPSSLFINDGSFMERFKQLQQEIDGKSDIGSQRGDFAKTALSGSGGKLAFSLKQKSKSIIPSVKLGEDEEEDEKGDGDASDYHSDKRRKLCQPETSNRSPKLVDVVPPSPSDPKVKNIADKLAAFVAKNGRQIEHITRQKNPGDTPFKFLFDCNCAEYKYYEHRLEEEEKVLAQTKSLQIEKNGSSSSHSASTSQRVYKQSSSYPSSPSPLHNSVKAQSESLRRGESVVPKDPIAMMEYYAKKAAEEERRKLPKKSQDEMPPPPTLHGPSKKGHHMGDFIPQEELEKFLASCNDLAAQRAAKETAERSRIQADNIGHKLLSKMGWKEGEGVGGSQKGITDPITAGCVKLNNLGVGAHQPGEVTPDDDIYEQYKKRMMLGYRYRPNPLNNPRKAYY